MRAEMKKISDERARVKAMQDETYLRMRSLKSDKYGKTKVWGENRCAAGGLVCCAAACEGYACVAMWGAASQERCCVWIGDQKRFRYR